METRLEGEAKKLEKAAKKHEIKHWDGVLPSEVEAEEPELWSSKEKPNRFKRFLAKIRTLKPKKKQKDKMGEKTRELLEKERKKIIYLALEELRIIGRMLVYIGKGGDIDVVDQGIHMQLGAKLDASSPQVRELIGLVEYLKNKREEKIIDRIKHKIEDALSKIQNSRQPANEAVPVNFGTLLEKARKMMEAEEKGVNQNENITRVGRPINYPTRLEEKSTEITKTKPAENGVLPPQKQFKKERQSLEKEKSFEKEKPGSQVKSPERIDKNDYERSNRNR